MYQSLSATDSLTYTEKTWSSFWTSLLLDGQAVFLFFFIMKKVRNNKITNRALYFFVYDLILGIS